MTTTTDPHWMKHHPEEGHRDAIRYHMNHARACRSVLNRIRDTDHDRRRLAVQVMKDHVQRARQHSRAIVAAHHDAADRLPGNPERSN